MKYIYDVMLNITDYNTYYEFYEWKKSDRLINVKKVLLFKVSNQVMNDLINYDIIVDKSFLKRIKNDFIVSKKDINNISYMCLFSNGVKSLGVIFKSNGSVMYKSSMIVDEEDEVNNIASKIKEYYFSYKRLSNNSKCVMRDDYSKVIFFKRFIKDAYQYKEYGKLQYLYQEIIGDNVVNIREVYKLLLNSLNNFNYRHNYLYSSLSNGFRVVEK